MDKFGICTVAVLAVALLALCGASMALEDYGADDSAPVYDEDRENGTGMYQDASPAAYAGAIAFIAGVGIVLAYLIRKEGGLNGRMEVQS